MKGALGACCKMSNGDIKPSLPTEFADTGQLNILDAEFPLLKIHSNTVYVLKLHYYYLKM